MPRDLGDMVADTSTVTFDYTAAWWTWEDWELELDWLGGSSVCLARVLAVYLLSNSTPWCQLALSMGWI